MIQRDNREVDGRALSLGQRLLILGCVALAYGSNYWPGQAVLAAGLQYLGNPPYAGFNGMFLPHLLLYSTVPAIVSALFWMGLSAAKVLPPIPLGRGTGMLRFGIAGALIAIVATLVLVATTMPPGTIHWIGIKPWGVAGNIFSNFYEEFIYRGFILAGLSAAIGFWPAAIVSSLLWAGGHTQYPLSFQALIAGMGIVWSWIRARAKTLWAPYLSHEIMDTVLDAVVG